VAVEVEPEKREVMRAVARVEMEEMEFSPTSPVQPPGTAAVVPAGRGTETVALVERAVEEAQEVGSTHLPDRTEQPILGVAEEEMAMAMESLVRAGLVL
jgi:hypothetical protein